MCQNTVGCVCPFVLYKKTEYQKTKHLNPHPPQKKLNKKRNYEIQAHSDFGLAHLLIHQQWKSNDD